MKFTLGHALYLFPLLGVVCLALLSYAYFIEPQRLVVKHETITIKHWDPAFDGLRIAMLADIHGGSNFVTEEKLRLVVEKTNEQEPDIVVLLGDYVAQRNDGKPLRQRPLKMPVETIAANLAGLKAKYGVFVVLGNHDGWHGDEPIEAAFAQLGYQVLQNKVAVIEKDGQRLRLLGLKDILELPNKWEETSALAKRILDGTGEGNIVILEHSPDVLTMVTGELSISPDLRLILAAHTHGGQVWLPVFGRPLVPSSFGQKYAYGHIRESGVDMFVTSGIGMSVLPIRFMVPPEIVVLTIRSEPPA